MRPATERFYSWGNDMTFTTPRIIQAFGECQIQDMLYNARLEQGLTEDEIEEISNEDTLDEVKVSSAWVNLVKV